jgi:3-oxoadipate enol-lactonase
MIAGMPYATSHDTPIYYEVHGSGPAVVFAHGMGGNSLSWWQQIPAFSRGLRAIPFSHRGFSRSTCPPEAFQPGWFADDLRAILDVEKIERAALVCQSMGGWTGLRTAMQSPERVACLVLCATPGGLNTPSIAAAREKIAAGIGSEPVLRGNLALAPDYPERAPAMALLYDQIQGLNPGVPPEALVRLGDPAVQVEPDELSEYRVPTLVIACEHDQLFPPAAIREVAALIPGAELYDFKGAGHSSYFEDPTTFNEIVGSFVRKHLP